MNSTRNVVLVTIDSLRADHCGFHGYDGHTTPTLDGMAASGVAFEHAIAPGPKTPESMPVMVTGWPLAEETYDLGATEWVSIIRPHLERHGTIAEGLRRRGYETIGFSPNGFASRYFGFDRGFDRFEDFLDDELRPGFELPGVVRGPVKWRRREGNWKLWEGFYDDVITAVEAASEPYFLWVFLLDVHSPYIVPRQYRSQSWLETVYANFRSTAVTESSHVRDRLLTAYDDTIRYADSFLERARTDLPGNPVFVVTADHGEALGDHGHFGHETHLFEENVHVPLVVDGVGSGTVDRPVSLAALPAVVGAAAEGVQPGAVVDDVRDATVVTTSGEGHRIAVRTQRFKYLRDPQGDTLYDLALDPHETVDCSHEHPGVTRMLARVAGGYRHARREERTVSTVARRLAGDGVA